MFILLTIFFSRLKAIQKLSSHVNVETDDPISNEELQDLNKDILKRYEQLNQVHLLMNLYLKIEIYYLNIMYFYFRWNNICLRNLENI